MKYEQYIKTKSSSFSTFRKLFAINTSSQRNQNQYAKLLVKINNELGSANSIIYFQNSIPIKIITGLDNIELKNKLKLYTRTKSITKDDFDSSCFIAGKLTTLGLDAINEKEFISKIPKSIDIQSENLELTKRVNINSHATIDTFIRNSGFKIIKQRQDFKNLCKETKAVLCIQIDWSGVDRIGRVKLIETLSKKEFNSIPKYIINNSNNEIDEFSDLIKNYTKPLKIVTHTGSGEILLLKKGKIVDYITRGFMINQSILIKLFNKWTTDNRVDGPTSGR